MAAPFLLLVYIFKRLLAAKLVSCCISCISPAKARHKNGPAESRVELLGRLVSDFGNVSRRTDVAYLAADGSWAK